MSWTPCIFWPGCGATVEGGCSDCPAEIEQDFGDYDDDEFPDDPEVTDAPLNRRFPMNDDNNQSAPDPYICYLDEAVAYLERFNPAAVGKVRQSILKNAESMISQPDTFACETYGYYLHQYETGEFRVWVAPYLWYRSIG